MRLYPWRICYTEAVCEDERVVRLVRINTAVNACLGALMEIGADTGRAMEQKEILCALSDLRVLTHLHRKYA